MGQWRPDDQTNDREQQKARGPRKAEARRARPPPGCRGQAATGLGYFSRAPPAQKAPKPTPKEGDDGTEIGKEDRPYAKPHTHNGRTQSLQRRNT